MAISLIHGPSGSGKTNRVIRTVVLSERYNLKTIVIKPHIFNVPPERVIKKDGIPAVTENVYIWGLDIVNIEEQLTFVLVEDAQFMSKAEIHTILDTFPNISNNIVFYGPREDYAGEPFESIDYLLENKKELLDVDTPMEVKCSMCKTKVATKTQRLINGVPAGFGPRVFMTDFVKHVPVCEDCYIHPAELGGRA